jgi:hypothetical protein
MKTVVGTFSSHETVEAAVDGLRRAGIDRSRINVLTPHSDVRDVRAVPEEDAEAEGPRTPRGAVGGGAAGLSAGNALPAVLPKDELPVYLDALRRRRSVVVVLAEDDKEALKAREILEHAGAESLDAARDMWWIGLRSAEEESYQKSGEAFAADEALYRRGFEAALGDGSDGPSSAREAALRARYGEVAAEKAFQRGFERGCLYRDSRVHHPEMS